MPRKQAPQQSYAPPLAQSHTLVQLGAPQGSNNFLCKDALGEERLVEISKSLKRMKGLIVMRGISSFLRKAGPDADNISKITLKATMPLSNFFQLHLKRMSDWLGRLFTFWKKAM